MAKSRSSAAFRAEIYPNAAHERKQPPKMGAASRFVRCELVLGSFATAVGGETQPAHGRQKQPASSWEWDGGSRRQDSAVLVINTDGLPTGLEII